ncbi:hypothetical protein GCM10022207_71540 [Streptomyces lannensis]|uniref:Methyltransferase domain-containing protein n=1 Tax=Streptomyces lannensis TaxID=766498 RepID=A0ABP7L559_9ACTN
MADLHESERVLDLGAGGGIDVLLSARRVGPTSKAYGLDMTEEMLALALENQQKAGATNADPPARSPGRLPLRRLPLTSPPGHPVLFTGPVPQATFAFRDAD